jgi:tetratricopeptide (TPR) repeat protein
MDRRHIFAGGMLSALAAVYCARTTWQDRPADLSAAPAIREPGLLQLSDIQARQLGPEPRTRVIATAFPFIGNPRSAPDDGGPELVMPGEVTPGLSTPEAPVVELPSASATPMPIETAPAEVRVPPVELPVQSPPSFTSEHLSASAPEPPAEIVAAIARAERLTANGRSLSERGAIYSARSQLVQALRELAEAYDEVEATMDHSRALNAALRAIEESHDFERRHALSTERVDVARLVAGHRTTVLKDQNVSTMRPAEAAEIYQQHAVEQVTTAVQQSAAASLPMYGLGRISAATAKVQLPSEGQDVADAVVWYQAALQTDPCNVAVAHELGTLYARRGEWQLAKSVLQRAINIRPHPTTWSNLAQVHRKLGEEDWARAAQSNAARSGGVSPSTGKLPPIQWVDPETFAKSTGPNEAYFPQQSLPTTTAKQSPAAGEPRSATKPRSNLSWLPWSKSKQR